MKILRDRMCELLKEKQYIENESLAYIEKYVSNQFLKYFPFSRNN